MLLQTDEQYREEELERDMGVGSKKLAEQSALKQRLFDVLYHPRFEMFIFLLIFLSVGLLVAEVLHPEGEHSGWLAAVDKIGGREFTPTFFFYLDVVFTGIFAIEYGLKLWIAPRKWYFVRKNWIDLLAILPILRIFRLGRAVRLLRLLRLLRLVRVGAFIQQYIDALDRRFAQRSVENEIIAVYLVFSIVFGTVGILVFEKGHNDGFKTLGDGLWWCIVTITTVGYGDISPETTGGKVVATVIMFIGLTFWALLTGTVSSVIIEHAKRNEGESIVVSSLSGHVVICGWNDTGRRLVSDLNVADRDTHIVILQEDGDLPRLNDTRIHYLIADPTTEKGLDAARISHARVAVVLADTRGGREMQDVDARSILTALAIERGNSEVHTIVELLNENNVFHVRNASVDEVIVAGSYMGTMLSQSVQFPGLTDVFQSLFGVGEGVQLREHPISEELMGSRFADAGRLCSERGMGVLLGYRRGKDLKMTPPPDTVLSREDTLIVMEAMA